MTRAKRPIGAAVWKRWGRRWVPIVTLILAAGLSLQLSCYRRFCSEDNPTISFGDTAPLRPCTTDKVILLPEVSVLYPTQAGAPLRGANGTGGADAAGVDQGSEKLGAAGSAGNEPAFGSVVYMLKVVGEDGRARQYFHVDVELSGGVDLVDIAPVDDLCKVEGRSWVRCVMGPDGSASFEVIHGNRGGGSLTLSTHTFRAAGAGGAGGSDSEVEVDLTVHQPAPQGSRIRPLLPHSSEFVESELWCGEVESEAEPCASTRDLPLVITLVDALGQPIAPPSSLSFDLFLQVERGDATLSDSGCTAPGEPRLEWTMERGAPVMSGPSLCVGAAGVEGSLLTSDRAGAVLATPIVVPPIPYLTLEDGAMGGAGGEAPDRGRLLTCPSNPIPDAAVLSGESPTTFYTDADGFVYGQLERETIAVRLQTSLGEAAMSFACEVSQ